MRREVVAVDVGYGQLAWSLRTDERVRVLDRTNVRTLTPELIGGPVDLTVADLSFISLRLVLPALAACTAPDGDLAPMVKPQFEVGQGPGRPGRSGPRSGSCGPRRCWPSPRRPPTLGLGVAGVVASPLPGPTRQRRVLPVVAPGRAEPADPDEARRVAGATATPVSNEEAAPMTCTRSRR